MARDATRSTVLMAGLVTALVLLALFVLQPMMEPALQITGPALPGLAPADSVVRQEVELDSESLPGETVAVDLSEVAMSHQVTSLPSEARIRGTLPISGQSYEVSVESLRRDPRLVVPREDLRLEVSEPGGPSRAGKESFQPPGLADLRLEVDGERLAEVLIAVEEADTGAIGIGEAVWKLVASRTMYDPKKFFEVPVFAMAYSLDGGELRPRSVAEDVRLQLRDLQSQLPPKTLTIRAGMAMSEPVTVPLKRSTDYRLVALPELGPRSNELEISWQSHGPALELRAAPAVQESFAARVSPARVTLFLERDGERILPPPGARLVVNQPAGVEVEPAEPISNDEGLWRVQGFGGAMLTQAARVQFVQPDLGLSATADLDFRFPWLQLILAAMAGVLGVLVARRSQLVGNGVKTYLEVAAAAIGGLLLCLALLEGWLPSVVQPLRLLSAAGVGVLGGYLGEAVFQGLSRLLFPMLTSSR